MKRLIVAAAVLLVSTPAFADIAEHIDSAEIFAGLGVGGYNRDLGSVTSANLGWSVRAGIDAFRYFGAELFYQGNNANASTFFIPNQAPLCCTHVTGNELSIDAKVGYPIMIGDHLLKPYGLVGIGINHIGVDDSLQAVGLGSSTNYATPLGLGISYNIYQMWAVDARYTYNFLAGSRSTLAPSGDMWSLGFNIGAKFGG